MVWGNEGRRGSAMHRGGSAMHRGGSARHRGGSAMHREGSAMHRGGSAMHREGSAMHREGSAMHREGSSAHIDPEDVWIYPRVAISLCLAASVWGGETRRGRAGAWLGLGGAGVGASALRGGPRALGRTGDGVRAGRPWCRGGGTWVGRARVFAGLAAECLPGASAGVDAQGVGAILCVSCGPSDPGLSGLIPPNTCYTAPHSAILIHGSSRQQP